MEKQEQKKNIHKLINTYIKRANFGEYASVVREIVERRYLMFDMTMDESRAKEELDALVSNLVNIRFADTKDYTKEEENTLGYYSPSDKEIVLYRDRLKYPEKMYDAITHEVYHVLGSYKDEKGTALRYYREGEVEPTGTGLNEAFNEYGAYLAYTRNRKEREDKIGVKTDGYGNITFIPRLLAAAFGTPETTIVGEGLKNRGALSETICGNIVYTGNSEENYKRMSIQYKEFERFEDNVNILFNLNFDEDVFRQLSSEEKSLMKKNATKSIIEYGYNQLIKMVKVQSDLISLGDEESVKKFAYCYYKLEAIGQEAASYLDSMTDQKELLDWIRYKREAEGVIITDINKITRVGKEIGNKEDFKRYLKLTLNGSVDKAIDEIKSKYNIDINKRKEEIGKALKKEKILNSEFAQFMERKDYKQFGELDDRRKHSVAQIGRLARRDQFKKWLRARVNDLFNSQERLPEGTERIEQESIAAKSSFLEELKEKNTKEKTKDNDRKESVNKKAKEIKKDEEDKEL